MRKKAENPREKMAWLHPREAEVAVIGSCLLNGRAVIPLLGTLEPEDFHYEDARTVWGVMAGMARKGQAIDVGTVGAELGKLGKGDLLPFLARAAASTPTSLHAQYYADIVVDRSHRRKLVNAASQIAQFAAEEEENPLARAMGELLKLSRRNTAKVIEPEAGWEEYLRLVERRREGDEVVGIPTGWKDIDGMIGGLRDGDLIVVGGRPGMGKTTLVEVLADRVARRGVGVLFVSLEMPYQQLLDRRVWRRTGIPITSIEKGHRSDEVEKAVGELLEEQIIYLDDPGLTTTRLFSEAFYLREMGKIGLIIVDYLQLFRDDPPRDGSENLRITRISANLKEIARELGVPVVAVSQLNRSVEMRADKHPQLSDLRQSGAIEQDAGVVLLTYRESYYKPECGHTIVEVQVAKNRYWGRTGTAQLLFRPKYGDLVDVVNRR